MIDLIYLLLVYFGMGLERAEKDYQVCPGGGELCYTLPGSPP